MAWYRAGTVGVTNGSTTVALSGGNALANIFPGDSFLGPDGRAYEVALVTSATSFTLATAYQGATATGQPYAIQPTGSTGALRLLNDQVSDLVTNYQTGRDAWASAPASTLKGRKSSGAGAVENLTPADVLTLLSGGTPGALTGTERLPVLQGTSAVGLTVNQLLSRAAGQALPFEIGGQRIATMTSAGVGFGTATPRAPIDSGLGPIAAGREYFKAATFSAGALPLTHGCKIKTNIQPNAGVMCRVRVTGYDYRAQNTINLNIVFYAYTSSQIYNAKASSSGSWTPEITLGYENGKVVIFFDKSMSDGYYTMFDVDVLSHSAFANPAFFLGWTVVDEPYVGTATVNPPYTNRFGYALFQNAEKCMDLRRMSSDGHIAGFWRGTAMVGSISVTASATSYNTSSDYRLKDGVVEIGPVSAIDRVKQLRPVRFSWLSTGEVVDGFLAHEAAEVVPEAVTGEKDAVEEIGDAVGYREHDPETGAPILASKETLTGIPQAEAPEGYAWTKTGERPVYQGIDQSKLVPLLAAGLKAALGQIEDLASRLAALEAAA